jgi:putative membrane protein
MTAILLSPSMSACAFLQQLLPGLTLSDSNIVSVLDGLDENEIDTAQLAREKATAPEVKAFAGRVMNEHRELTQTNGRLAEQLGLQPESSALAVQFKQAHEQAMRKLRMTSGAAFDRAYVAYEIEQHVQAFNFVEAAAESEGTPRLKQELVRTGPDLLSHISAARALERHLGSEPRDAVAVR